MKQALKDNFDSIWKALALMLLSICVYFLIRINDKVDYSYKSNVEQQIINGHYSDRFGVIEDNLSAMGVNVAELAKRQYHLEQKLNDCN